MEINGIVNQYWSYAVGIANGGSAVTAAFDDNTFKDVYFRVARKWFGSPLDGVLGKVEQDGKDAPPAEQTDESVYKAPGLDFWRTVGFETGVFGWFGKSFVPDSLAVPPTVPPTINPVNVNDPTTFGIDYFERIGCDARLQYFDLDLYGFAFYGHDPFPGFDQSYILAKATDHYGFFLESDYMFKPWITGFLRYEQVWIENPGFSTEQEGRVVPGVVLQIRQNLHVSSEIFIPVVTLRPRGTRKRYASGLPRLSLRSRRVDYQKPDRKGVRNGESLVEDCRADGPTCLASRSPHGATRGSTDLRTPHRIERSSTHPTLYGRMFRSRTCGRWRRKPVATRPARVSGPSHRCNRHRSWENPPRCTRSRDGILGRRKGNTPVRKSLPNGFRGRTGRLPTAGHCP